MVHQSVIEGRLSQLGIRVSRWFKAEIRELRHTLMDHERIIALVCGRYFGGFAMLVATDQRILLIDKKTFFLTVEDIRYDMISEIDFNTRMFDSTLRIFTLNKQHQFTTIKHKQQLRALTSYAQQRVMELRQYQHQQHHEQAAQTGLIPQATTFSALPTRPAAEPLTTPEHYEALPQSVGATAMQGSHRTSLNPYTTSSVTTRRPWLARH